FWLRSSVVSVLNSLTTITRAPPSVSGYQIFAAPAPSCSACNTGDVMTVLLQYRLVSSGDSAFPESFSFSFCLHY
ncbi:hypothetical protein GYMLUDRAFT_694478, partial [Collybiopsis luxurians FD-317 M1]